MAKENTEAMGLSFRKLFGRVIAKKQMRILMVGLNAAYHPLQAQARRDRHHYPYH
ncbi:hypothetical protein PIB30_096711, partial [Stylosanthes scabra]|nr:hypothetical protein [Stylosanthes scabra]